MKRSEINTIITESIAFFRRHRFFLPPFAWIKPDEWKAMAKEYESAIGAGLGWDVTDFGLGRFSETGLLLFTLRNGVPKAQNDQAKTYCEKIIHLREGQECPSHYHTSKMEDIINRGGGELLFRLYWAGADGRSYSDLEISIEGDGRTVTCEAGGVIRLGPGESLTIPPFLYHSFWAEGEDVLAGEVSRVNDDVTDNFFYTDLPRFSDIQEDEPPEYLLVHELSKFLS
ncbi:MAG: D-lyxose/D-mannose family sugar isomerase [Deltaproteobacteria bacterium]|nr:D-lyxose/D-mannose family sugar isomerase [Candidatus Zymogenaceae bacterium]